MALKFNFSSKTHSTLKGWFNQTLIKTQKLDVEFGKFYSRAFEKRQKADYDDYVVFNLEEVQLDLENAKKFVDRVKTFIANESQ